MKKLLAILVTLLLCLGCCAALAESEVPAEYLGNWKLESISLFGIELGKEDLDYTVIVNIHEDNTIVFAKDENTFAVTQAVYADGVCCILLGEELMPLPLDENGLMNMTLTQDGLKLDMKLARTSEQPAVPAQVAPMLGRWEMDHVDMMGLKLTQEDMGEITVDVYADQYGALAMGEDFIGFRLLVAEDGSVSMIDSEQMVYPLAVNEQDQLVMTLKMEELTMEVVLNRVGEAVAVETEAVQTAPAAAVEAGAFDGFWTTVEITAFGMTFKPADLEMAPITLEINGDTAVLTADEEVSACTVRYEANGAYVHDGVEDVFVSLNEKGQLVITMEEDGLSMSLCMEKDGAVPAVVPAADAAAPAAEPVADAAAESAYDGDWTTVKVGALGMTFTLEDLELEEISLQITGTYASMNFDGEVGECTVRYEADGVFVNDGFVDMPVYINEDGQLVAEIVDGELVMQLYMERK